MLAASSSDSRCHLYRLLSEPVRVRMLALAAVEELSVGELADLLGESQPNVSRHAASLRQAGLLLDRREGTRVFVRLARRATDDAVVADALSTGHDLCSRDGSLSRVGELVRVRDARTREFFARPPTTDELTRLADEIPGYLFALSAAVGRRELAVDAGTGDGAWLDILAPMFGRVVALDRSAAQLERARHRIAARGYDNVTLLDSELDGEPARLAVGSGADLVNCSRVLHHSPLPRQTLRALASLARPGGLVVVVDYLSYDDDRLRERQADIWMGFDPTELRKLAADAGLVEAATSRIPPQWLGTGPDHHLGWLVLTARRPATPRVDGHQPEA